MAQSFPPLARQIATGSLERRSYATMQMGTHFTAAHVWAGPAAAPEDWSVI